MWLLIILTILTIANTIMLIILLVWVNEESKRVQELKDMIWDVKYEIKKDK
jgi:hypothetical protein